MNDSRARRVLALSVVALSLFLSPGARLVWAQEAATLRGEVALPDGSVAAGATVTAARQSDGAVRTTTADDAGRYAIATLVPGDYVVTARTANLAGASVRVSLEPREVRSLRLTLDLASRTETVTVTASVSGTHSPSSTVLTQARLQHMPALQRLTLPDAVATAAPGMIRGHDDFVHVRGQEVALNTLINGVSFWENPHALFSTGVSPEMIETANVMTGGFPAEYGNRFGGVLDVVTRSGLQMPNQGALALAAGSRGRASALIEYGGHEGDFGYFVLGSAFRSSRFLSPPDPEAIHDTGSGGHLFAQADARTGSAGALRLTLMGDGTTLELPKTAQDVELRPLALPRQRSRQQTAIAAWTTARGAMALNASFYQRWSRADLNPAAGPLTAAATWDRSLVTIGGKVDVTAVVGTHTLKLGTDLVHLRPDEELTYLYDGYRQLTHLLGLPHIHLHGNRIDYSGRETGGQISAYIQDDIPLGARVTANVGVRLDRYDLVVDATHLSPRVNVAAHLGGVVTHVSYNRFFVPPPIEGLLSSSAGLTAAISEIGTALPPLEPTTEDQIEVGASAPVARLRVSATAYYRRSDNPVHTTVWPDSRVYSYASFDRARARGLELKIEAPALAGETVSGFLNYALGRVHFYNPITGGFTTEADHLEEASRFLAPMDQTHTLTGGLTYRHPTSGFWIGTSVDYGSGTPIGHGGDHEHGAEAMDDHEHAAESESAARVPGHWTADLAIGLDVLRGSGQGPRLSLRVDVDNLADNVYLIAQEGEFTVRQYAPPRGVSVTARIRF